MRLGWLSVALSLLSSANIEAAKATLLRTSQVSTDAKIVAVSRDFQYAALSLGSSLAILDIQTGKELFVTSSGRSVMEDGQLQSAVVFTPESNELLIGHEDGYLESVSVRSGARTGYSFIAFERLQSISIVSPPGFGSSLLLIAHSKSFSVLNYPSMQIVHRFDMQDPTLPDMFIDDRFITALHPDGKFAAVGDKNRSEIRLYDLVTGKEVLAGHDMSLMFFYRGYPVKLHFSSQGSEFSYFVKRAQSVEWLAKSLISDQSFKYEEAFIAPEYGPYFSFSDDGARALLGHHDFRCAFLLDARSASGNFENWLDGSGHGWGTSVALSADGRLGLTLHDGTLSLWSVP